MTERRAPSDLVIRPQEERDAAAATALDREADDSNVRSEAGWTYWQRRRNPRERVLGLVAEHDGHVVATGRAGLNISTTTPGESWANVKVTAAYRRRGIGSAAPAPKWRRRQSALHRRQRQNRHAR